MPSSIDFDQVRRRLAAGEGGYEVVHTSPGLELGVYVLVAPEPDRQQPHEDDEVYVVLEGSGVLEIEGETVTSRKARRCSCRPAPSTASSATSTSASSSSSPSPTAPTEHGRARGARRLRRRVGDGARDRARGGPVPVRHPSRALQVGLADALAAGFMLAASVLLFYTGARENTLRTIGGALIGVLFVDCSSRLLSGRKNAHFGALAGVDARKALLLVALMTVHSFAEGVGVSFGDGEGLGLVAAIAIAIHNIPEGLAISLVLVPQGVGVLRAASWSVFSSLPQTLVAVPVRRLVRRARTLGLGFAGGAMLWMVTAEVIPDALRATTRRGLLSRWGRRRRRCWCSRRCCSPRGRSAGNPQAVRGSARMGGRAEQGRLDLPMAPRALSTARIPSAPVWREA